MPLLITRYGRKYFQSSNGIYRITLDTDFIFYLIDSQNNTFLNNYFDDTNVILELKYNNSFNTDAHWITNHFPFRMTKSSKYVSGIEKFYFW